MCTSKSQMLSKFIIKTPTFAILNGSCHKVINARHVNQTYRGGPRRHLNLVHLPGGHGRRPDRNDVRRTFVVQSQNLGGILALDAHVGPGVRQVVAALQPIQPLGVRPGKTYAHQTPSTPTRGRDTHLDVLS